MATDVLQWNGINVASPPVAGIPEVEVASYVVASLSSAAFATEDETGRLRSTTVDLT